MNQARLPGGKRTAAAAGTLGLHALLAVVSLLIAVVAVIQPIIGMSLEDLEVVDGILLLTFMLRVFLLLIAGLFFMAWLHVSYGNTRKFSGSTYSPGSAVFSFFIPFVNLVRPYTVVQEMWRKSETRPGMAPQNSKIVLLWWLGYLGWATVVGILFEIIPESGELSPLHRVVLLLGDGLGVIGAALGAFVVFKIRQRQKQQIPIGSPAIQAPQQPLSYPAV